MKNKKRRCRHCGCLFEVCGKVKKHEYCKKKKCRKARKRRWQKEKMQRDAQYRNDQKQAQKDWMAKNPDYWKRYRDNHPEYTRRNKKAQRLRNRAILKKKSRIEEIAKMDAMSPEKFLKSGRYLLYHASSDDIAKMDAIMVEIKTISVDYKYFGP